MKPCDHCDYTRERYAHGWVPPDPEKRRWHVGRSVVVDGVRFVVEKGSKARDDLVMRMYAPAGHIASMSQLAVLADFISENENFIHQDHWQDSGEEHLCKYMNSAMAHGYNFADVTYVKGPQAKKSQGQSRPMFYE